MSFEEDLQEDMNNEFCDTDEFAESIVYTPKASTPETIPAIVIRNQINSQGESRILHKTMQIVISNAVITEIDTTGDKVTVSPLPGQEAVDHDVVRIIESGQGHWKLEITQ